MSHQKRPVNPVCSLLSFGFLVPARASWRVAPADAQCHQLGHKVNAMDLETTIKQSVREMVKLHEQKDNGSWQNGRQTLDGRESLPNPSPERRCSMGGCELRLGQGLDEVLTAWTTNIVFINSDNRELSRIVNTTHLDHERKRTERMTAQRSAQPGAAATDVVHPQVQLL